MGDTIEMASAHAILLQIRILKKIHVYFKCIRPFIEILMQCTWAFVGSLFIYLYTVNINISITFCANVFTTMESMLV